MTEIDRRDFATRRSPGGLKFDAMSSFFDDLRASNRAAQDQADRIIRRFARHVCRGGGPIGAPDLDWEDVAQETSRKLYSVGLDQYRGGGSESSYLYSMVKATVIQMARSTDRRQKRERSVSLNDSVSRLVDPIPSLDVRSVLAALDAACGDLIERFFLLDETHADLARDLGLAESSVRAKLSRCLRKAREIATKRRPS
jgi:RNA polymerase sigma factor (sigma-70 family)